MSNYYFLDPCNYNDELEPLKNYLFNSDTSICIIISGPAGMGKSSVSIKLCELLGIRNYISTDLVRIISSTEKKDKEILKLFSHECWKYYGKYSDENMVKGFRKQSQIICNKINVLLNDAQYHKKNTLIEGIHLLPSLFSHKESEFKNLKFVYIYITTSFLFFKNTLLPNRVISTYRHRKIDEYDNERLNRFRVFKEMWDSELTEYGITPIYNNSTPQVLLSRILESIITNLKG